MKNKTEALAVALRGVSYAIDAEGGTRTLLHEMNMSIPQGQWLAVVGSNGSGKSTLAKLMAKLYSATTGMVVHGDAAAGGCRPYVGIIFQNPDVGMIGETVYEDVRFGLDNYGFRPEEAGRLAMDALERVGLAPLADMPAAQLSGGQKQLLQAAGCLAVQPEVLIFDEATSMLDLMSRQHLLHAARKLHGAGTTVIWITQLLDEVAASDRVVALQAGEMVFDGSKEAFLYPQNGEEASVCESLGFMPPFVVQVARKLMERGMQLHPLPTSVEELGRAVGQWR
ncbi:ATP-binding cassette domain-containing protein [Paenibacillus oenotherae]|uniref:ATP-binding cassette domain-containing protein n=1 Tax=Paenibacillus oenotherae TaxID=1435645 RepID=A0ABS7D015_9BACL|nr:ATP-binding cassette domain-containing protein [Paenibacillus oenotherae]MBW7473154.1 ATP-binding cassette domain-containing protein [Paenibacillus oenotherae]